LLEKTRIGPAEIHNVRRDMGIAFDIGALTVRRLFANWMPIGSCQVSPIRFECALPTSGVLRNDGGRGIRRTRARS
jgi:hypothetical protein